MSTPGVEMAKQVQQERVASYGSDYGYGDKAAGSGWLFFAGTILGLAGLMRILDSLWAFRYKGALPEGLQNGVFGSDLKNYAWAWLIVGIVLIVSSVLVLGGSQFRGGSGSSRRRSGQSVR